MEYDSTISSYVANEATELAIEKLVYSSYEVYHKQFDGLGLYISYRLPLCFMLYQLDLTIYFGLFNFIVTLCSITIIANLLGKQVKPQQILLAGFTATFTTLLLYLSFPIRYNELYAFLSYLLIHLPLLLEGPMFLEIYNSITTLNAIRPDGASGSGGGGKSNDIRGQKGTDEVRQTEATNTGTLNSNCNYCASNGLEIKGTAGQHCRLCGWALNMNGEMLYRQTGRKFEDKRREFLSSRPEIVEELSKMNNTPYESILREMGLSADQSSSSKTSKYVPPHRRQPG